MYTKTHMRTVLVKHSKEEVCKTGGPETEEKSKMFQPIRRQGRNLVFHIGSKNTNLVE